MVIKSENAVFLNFGVGVFKLCFLSGVLKGWVSTAGGEGWQLGGGGNWEVEEKGEWAGKQTKDSRTPNPGCQFLYNQKTHISSAICWVLGKSSTRKWKILWVLRSLKNMVLNSKRQWEEYHVLIMCQEVCLKSRYCFVSFSQQI